MENGQYARTALEYLQDIGQVTTFLNSDPIQYQYASDLAIASTIIHESVHAYLTKLYFTDKGVILENYPEMLSRFFKQHRKPANEVQHNLFTKYFVEDIAKSLEDYGKSKGYTLESSFYKT